jgi:hypothetical protein
MDHFAQTARDDRKSVNARNDTLPEVIARSKATKFRSLNPAHKRNLPLLDPAERRDPGKRDRSGTIRPSMADFALSPREDSSRTDVLCVRTFISADAAQCFVLSAGLILNDESMP